MAPLSAYAHWWARVCRLAHVYYPAKTLVRDEQAWETWTSGTDPAAYLRERYGA